MSCSSEPAVEFVLRATPLRITVGSLGKSALPRSADKGFDP
jgi:hypothetical protein